MLQCFKGRCTFGRGLVDDISVMSNCVTKVGRTLKITSVNTVKTSHFWKPFAFSMIGSVWGVIHICIICLCQSASLTMYAHTYRGTENTVR